MPTGRPALVSGLPCLDNVARLRFRLRLRPGSRRPPDPNRPTSLRPERLARLAADRLALVADALPLVRLGGADLADIGGELADGLLVRPGDRDVRRVGDHDTDALRSFEHDLVGEADLERDRVRLL